MENKKEISAWNSGNNHLNMKPEIFLLSQHNFIGKQIPFVYNIQQHVSAFISKPNFSLNRNRSILRNKLVSHPFISSVLFTSHALQ